MSQQPTDPERPEGAPSAPPPDAPTVIRLAVRLAAIMLGAGSQTDDVELAIASMCTAYGVVDVQYAVTFSGIQVSYDEPGGRRPITLVRIVRTRKNDFARLARAAAVVDAATDGQLSIADAQTAIAELERPSWPYPRIVEYLAPPLSATGSTLIFGGSALDAFVTVLIALAVQPLLAALDRSELPPFFRSVFGAAASALLVGLVVGLDVPVESGLVLTGSLLGLLPGYALVSGFRDLIDQSIISGSARLAEALLLGAGVAGGTAIGIAVADNFGVRLSLITVGHTDWSAGVSIVAALVAVGAFAVRLGVPPRYVWQSSLLGAVAWIIFALVASGMRDVQASLATFVAAMVVGIVGRLIARNQRGPSALWVVPAILPLLPGLQIVLALLAATDQERVAGLVAAATTAFALGVGVAMGDIVVTTLLRLRDVVVAPAVGAVTGGVDDFILTPVERAVAQSRSGRSRDKGGQAD